MEGYEMIIEPKFGDPQCWKQIIKNNERLHHVEVLISTDKMFLPHVLVEEGFFPSTGQVKKNRPDLWRDVENFEVINFSFAQVEIWNAN